MTFTLDARRVSRSVQFDHHGPADDLRVADVPRPSAGDGQVLVIVVAAAINPGEIAVRILTPNGSDLEKSPRAGCVLSGA